MNRFDDEYAPCPLAVMLKTVGGKWKCVILWWLMSRPRRFTELRARLPGITPKVLTQELRQLEVAGFVNRKVFAEVPPRVEYSATALALAMKPVLLTMNDWAMANLMETPPRTIRRGSRRPASRTNT